MQLNIIAKRVPGLPDQWGCFNFLLPRTERTELASFPQGINTVAIIRAELEKIVLAGIIEDNSSNKSKQLGRSKAEPVFEALP